MDMSYVLIFWLQWIFRFSGNCMVKASIWKKEKRNVDIYLQRLCVDAKLCPFLCRVSIINENGFTIFMKTDLNFFLCFSQDFVFQIWIVGTSNLSLKWQKCTVRIVEVALQNWFDPIIVFTLYLSMQWPTYWSFTSGISVFLFEIL